MKPASIRTNPIRWLYLWLIGMMCITSNYAVATPATADFNNAATPSVVNTPLIEGDWTFSFINDGTLSNLGSLSINDAGVSDLGTDPDFYLIAAGNNGVTDGLQIQATSDTDPFELTSLRIAKGLFGETGLTIRGYLNGTQIVSQSVSLVDGAPGINPSQLVNFTANGWGILDQVRIENTSSNADFDIEMDDLTVTASTLPTIAFSPTTTSVTEGNSGTVNMTFTVTRTGNTDDASVVSYSSAGSGANPADATDINGGTFPSGSFTFLPTETSKTITVPINGDTTVEGNETLTATLSTPIGAILGTATAIGTITGDDQPSLSITANTASITEGNTGTTNYGFTVARTGNTSATASVTFTTTGSGGNPADAADLNGTLPTGTVNFAIGETTQTINIPVSGDNDIEANEAFAVSLSAPVNAVLGTDTATGVINNDDTVPQLSLSAVTVSANEGNAGTANYQIDVNRSGNTGVTSSVVITAVGSGANPADATDVGGAFPSTTLNFGIGDTIQSINLTVSGDIIQELDEQVNFSLSTPVNATIVTGSLNFTIVNDDVPNITNATIPDVAMNPGDTITTTLTVDDDGGNSYTNLTGTIAGIPLSNLNKVNNTTYTAEFTIPAIFAGIDASSDIPVSVSVQNSLGLDSNTYTTPISQLNDPIATGLPVAPKQVPTLPLPLIGLLGLLLAMIGRRRIKQ